MKKKLALLLASAMVLSTTATGFAASFSDIGDVPWSGAETYVNKAAELGIMVGETSNGKTVFRPKDSVTLCETIQITYSLLKAAENVSASSSVISKWTSVMNGYKIPSWAHEATAYCLENSIITVSDLPSIMSSAGASKKATREMVAYIMGRGLITADSSLSADDTSTSFKDNSSISTSALPYVAMLEDEGILSGDSNGNFNARAVINRSEMAVIVTKGYDLLKNASTVPSDNETGSISGFATNIVTYGDGIMMSMLDNGKTRSLYVGTDASVTFKDGSAGTPSSITGGQVLVVTYKGGNATSVAIQEDPPASTSTSSEATGIISSLSTSKIRLTGEKDYRYIYDKDIYVTLDGDSMDMEEFVDFVDDKEESVRATVTLDSDGYVVRIKAETLEDTVKGYITKINDKEIKIKNGDTYKFNSPTVTFNGDTGASLDDIIDAFDDGDDVYVILGLGSGNKVVSIDGDTDNEAEGGADRGTISSLSEEKLKIKDGDTYYIDDPKDVEVTIDGKSKDFDDLLEYYEDDETIYVVLDVDDDDYITEIDAEIRDNEDDDEVSGTISSVSSSKIKFTNGNTYSIDDPDDIDIKIDGKTKDFEDLEDAVEDYDKVKADLVIEDGYVTEVDAETSDDSDDDDGILEELTSSRLELSNGDEYDIDDPDGLYVTIDGKHSDFDELQDKLDDGARIRVELKVHNNYVIEIDAEIEKEGKSSNSRKSGDVTYISSGKIEIDDDYTYYFDDIDDVDVTLDGSSSDVDEIIDNYEGNEDLYAEVTYDDDDNVVELDVDIE